MKNHTHVRYLSAVKFFNGLADIEAGEVVRITKRIGTTGAWVVRDNGDTWAEIGVDGVRAEFCNPDEEKPNQLLIVHQAYKIGQSQYGLSQWRIAFLCSTRGLVEIYRSIRNVSCEFEQAALVRAEIAKFRNS